MAFISCLPMALMMLFSGTILKQFGFDERCINHAQGYTRMLIPMLFIQSQFDVTYKFLNCFSKTTVVVVILALTVSIHYILCYILVYRMRLDLIGVTIATNLNAVFNLTLIMLWIQYKESKNLGEAWCKPDTKCFAGLWDYCKMGFAACVMLCLEWWTYDM